VCLQHFEASAFQKTESKLLLSFSGPQVHWDYLVSTPIFKEKGDIKPKEQ